METKDTKSTLLDAARQLVIERGYAGTSVRELAARSGANIAAVNYHFGSREALLDQAILELFLEWGDRVGELEIDPAAEPLKQLAERSRPMVEGIPAAQPSFPGAARSTRRALCRAPPAGGGSDGEHRARRHSLTARFGGGRVLHARGRRRPTAAGATRSGGDSHR